MLNNIGIDSSSQHKEVMWKRLNIINFKIQEDDKWMGYTYFRLEPYEQYDQ